MALNSISQYGKSLALRLGGEKFRSFICLYLGWKDIVGELLAQKSQPFRFKDGILYVAVQNNSWQQELILKKEQIKAKCASLCNESIQDIMFYIRTSKPL